MCVTSLLCGPGADLWPFYGFLCKRFSLYKKDQCFQCKRPSENSIRTDLSADLKEVINLGFK